MTFVPLTHMSSVSFSRTTRNMVPSTGRIQVFMILFWFSMNFLYGFPATWHCYHQIKKWNCTGTMPRGSSHLQAVLVAEAPHRFNLDGAGCLVLPNRECLRPNQLEHPVSPKNLLGAKIIFSSSLVSPLCPLVAPCSHLLSHAQTRSHGSHRRGEPRNLSKRWKIAV